MIQERLEGSPNFSPKLPIKGITRRELIELGLAFGARFAGRRLFPVSGALPNPQRPVSELVASPEILELNIPGVTVERYPAEFPEVTSEVSESYTRNLKAWLGQLEFNEETLTLRERFTPAGQQLGLSSFEDQCELSFVGFDRIIPNRNPVFFYFDGNSDRFYTNILASFRSYQGETVLDEDKRMLGWSRANFSGDRARANLACNGRFLYEVYNPDDNEEEKFGIIIADIPNETKTVIKIKDISGLLSLHPQLTKDGNRLLLYFGSRMLPANFDPDRRGIYLVDLDNWQIMFNVDKPNAGKSVHLNESGSSMYVNWTRSLYNTETGEKTLVRWPRFLSSYESHASRNLDYVARLMGMFPAGSWVEGQWGIMAYTTEGFFTISAPGWSFSPRIVDDAGNICTTRRDVFKFEGGTYKLVKMGPETQRKVEEDGKPIEVRVAKFPK